MQIFHLGTADPVWCHSGLCAMPLRTPGSWVSRRCPFFEPGYAHSLAPLGLEPHFSYFHISSISCLTGEALSLYHRGFSISLKIVARRSFHLGTGRSFIVVLPVPLKSCWCPASRPENCFLLMICSRAFNLLLGGDFLLAYSVDTGSREQTGRQLEYLRFFPQIAGSRKMQGCYVWWDLKISIVDSTPLWIASRNILSWWAIECEVYLIDVQPISYHLSVSSCAFKWFKFVFFFFACTFLN